MDSARVATIVVIGGLAAVHLSVTGGGVTGLPEATRAALGASAATTFSRPWAFFTAPFIHYGWGHLLYNSTLLFFALPPVLRRLGLGPGLLAVYVASPVSSFLVNVLLIRPLAGMDVAYAEAAAPVRLVGASVVAFAAVGAALASGPLRSTRARLVALGAMVAYEAALELSGTTQPFVGTYHVGGFLVGLALGTAAAARDRDTPSAFPSTP